MSKTQPEFVPQLGELPPSSGISWEEWLDAVLREAYQPARFVRMTSHEETATGVALSEQFTNRLEIKQFVDSPPLTVHQVRFVLMKYQQKMKIPFIAMSLGLSKQDTYEVRRLAFQSLIRVISGNPLFELEKRERLTVRA